MKRRAVDNLLKASLDEDLDLLSSRPQSENKTLPRPILKPVFVAPSSLPVKSTPATIVDADDGDQSQEAKSLLYAAMEADKVKDNRSFEERRIEGTPFDINSVDDTDGLDEREEMKRWEERERERIKWEAEKLSQYDREQAEAERRRNMTEEERLKQDQEKEKEWMAKAESEGDGFKFLQKYYHKGAFYQDPSDTLQQRNYIQATGNGRGVQRDTLPAVLQVRDFGKKGRSKWTHLTNEDTTAHDYGWGDKKNVVNYYSIERMGGMRGDLENPSSSRKRRKPSEP